MHPIEAAIESLRAQEVPNIALTARNFNVNRSTLSRRWNKVSNPVSMQHELQQILS